MINKRRIIEPNWKKGGVKSGFYFIWAMPERSGGVYVNGGMTSGIYFMYNCF